MTSKETELGDSNDFYDMLLQRLAGSTEFGSHLPSRQPLKLTPPSSIAWKDQYDALFTLHLVEYYRCHTRRDQQRNETPTKDHGIILDTK
jgi:hypothetical protein